MIRKPILTAFVLAFLITQSQAATLELGGTASVDQGSGFGPASSYMQLNGGNRVRALKGCAKILYDNGYSTKVCDGQMAVVFSDPPEYVAGSLKDAPTVVTTPDAPGSDLLPAGLLAAAGIGAAVAISTAGGSSGGGGGSTVGGGNRAASP